jgi:Tfp pilus assembly major pilin PilA
MKKQQGLSFVGFIIVAMAVAMALITAFKVVPTYVEYFNVQQALASVAKQNNGATTQVIKEAYARHADISNISAVKPEDLIITQVGGRTVIRADYEKVVPLVANVSFLFQFEVEKSSSGSGD